VSEPKPIASLSSGLLARKGAARPAMRPQGFGQGAASLEDLGWDDMGFEPPEATEAPRDEDHDAFGDDVAEHARVHPTGLTPVQSPVHTQQAEIADRFGEGDVREDEAIDDFGEADEPEANVPEAAAASDAEPDFEPEPQFSVRVKPAVAAVVPIPAPRRAPRARSAPGGKAKAAFTLRLDPGRHLKLRLACAVNGRSAQQIVTDALDGLLSNMPELDAMAAKANRKG
jgi:hypothetical protein